MDLRKDQPGGIDDGPELPQSVDIVVPVFNEDVDLETKITQLRRFLKEKFPYRWTIRIVDNGSTDRTPEIGRALAARWPGEVEYLHLEEKGKGRAIRAGWTAGRAGFLCFMDLDLSTDLSALNPLIEPLVGGRCDLAVGSRLLPGSRVRRSRKRDALSRLYNRLLRMHFPRARFSDAQCGFKAATRAAAEELLPGVRDNAWFFDTELLLQARRKGFRIEEVPIQWTEDPGTKVRLPSTAGMLLKGLWRVRLSKPRRGGPR
ncbi:MAG: dolichyl-phosphate beta-glucosyltransferase, partial [Candidatus Aminicenantales bacterium]